MNHEPPSCSCHAPSPLAPPGITFARELLRIRCAYRYTDRAALEHAVGELRARIDRDRGEPLSLHCWVDDVWLLVDITVPMFVDHRFALTWFRVLARTAIDARFDVAPRTL